MLNALPHLCEGSQTRAPVVVWTKGSRPLHSCHAIFLQLTVHHDEIAGVVIWTVAWQNIEAGLPILHDQVIAPIVLLASTEKEIESRENPQYEEDEDEQGPATSLRHCVEGGACNLSPFLGLLPLEPLAAWAKMATEQNGASGRS